MNGQKNLDKRFFCPFICLSTFGLNWRKIPFFAQREKSPGRGPLQELEVGLRGGPYLLVTPMVNTVCNLYRQRLDTRHPPSSPVLGRLRPAQYNRLGQGAACILLHSTVLLDCTALYCMGVLHCTLLHCTVLLYCTALYCTVLYFCTALHFTTLYCCTLLRFTALYCCMGRGLPGTECRQQCSGATVHLYSAAVQQYSSAALLYTCTVQLYSAAVWQYSSAAVEDCSSAAVSTAIQHYSSTVVQQYNSTVVQ